MKKPKTKDFIYWLFWSHRGYMEWEGFFTKKEALKKLKEVDDGYTWPMLIRGRRLK